MKNNLIEMNNELAIIEHLPQTKQQAVTTLRNSPMQYWHSINPRTMLDVLNAPPVSLIEIKKELGEPKLQALMVKWLNSFIGFYSTNGTMDAMQVADTINLIIEEYYYYNIYDLKLFFKLAKLGHFGDTYGRIDGSVILSWLRKYDINQDNPTELLKNKYKIKS